MKLEFTGHKSIIYVGTKVLGYCNEDVTITIQSAEDDVSHLPRLSEQDLRLLELDDQALDIFESLFNKLIASGVITTTESTKKLLDDRTALDLSLNPPPTTSTDKPVVVQVSPEQGPHQS